MKFFAFFLLCLISILPVHAKKIQAPICPVFSCPAPPVGCNYGKPSIGQEGCPTGCGELICQPVCNNVQAPQCAAPPKGCKWNMQADEQGCPSCGQLICPTQCDNVQAPQCAAPPKGCNWSMQPDSQGCPSCGGLICGSAGPGGLSINKKR